MTTKHVANTGVQNHVGGDDSTMGVFGNRLPTFVFWVGFIGQKGEKTNKIKGKFDS